MRLNKIIFLFLILTNAFIFSQNANIKVKSNISKTKIKIGEKIKINLIIEDQKYSKIKILWNDIKPSDARVEIYTKKDFINNKLLNMEIIFTFFESKEYKGFYFIIPASIDNAEIINLKTDIYDISVINILNKEEIENIKNIQNPEKIKLKKEKPQAYMSFMFSRLIKIILFIFSFILLLLVSYFIFYKIMKKIINKKGGNKLSPYEDFLVKIHKLNFLKDDDRKITEAKLSKLTEIFKELILFEFSLNATAETTVELIRSLKNIDFDNKIIISIKNILEEIDLIKFAKAYFDHDRINLLKEDIKELGDKIHQYKLSITKPEDKDENI